MRSIWYKFLKMKSLVGCIITVLQISALITSLCFLSSDNHTLLGEMLLFGIFFFIFILLIIVEHEYELWLEHENSDEELAKVIEVMDMANRVECLRVGDEIYQIGDVVEIQINELGGKNIYKGRIAGFEEEGLKCPPDIRVLLDTSTLFHSSCVSLRVDSIKTAKKVD